MALIPAKYSGRPLGFLLSMRKRLPLLSTWDLVDPGETCLMQRPFHERFLACRGGSGLCSSRPEKDFRVASK